VPAGGEAQADAEANGTLRVSQQRLQATLPLHHSLAAPNASIWHVQFFKQKESSLIQGLYEKPLFIEMHLSETSIVGLVGRSLKQDTESSSTHVLGTSSLPGTLP
jgi:hypothetical protein